MATRRPLELCRSPQPRHRIDLRNRQVVFDGPRSINGINSATPSPVRKRCVSTATDCLDAENSDPAQNKRPRNALSPATRVRSSNTTETTLGHKNPSTKTSSSVKNTPPRLNSTFPRAPLTAPAFGRTTTRAILEHSSQRRNSISYHCLPVVTLPSSTMHNLVPKSLSQTLPRRSMPRSWFFDLHQDTGARQRDIIKQHHAWSSKAVVGPEQVDEDRDGLDKENIDPDSDRARSGQGQYQLQALGNRPSLAISDADVNPSSTSGQRSRTMSSKAPDVLSLTRQHAKVSKAHRHSPKRPQGSCTRDQVTDSNALRTSRCLPLAVLHSECTAEQSDSSLISAPIIVRRQDMRGEITVFHDDQLA